MRVKIIVNHQDTRSYRRFCRALLVAIKYDMIRRLSRHKLEIRKKYLDEKLESKFDYYALYVRFIQSMYLSWDNESQCYCITLDDSIKVRGYKVIFIWKMIEFGVGEIRPYPFVRLSFIKYSDMLKSLYTSFLKEGKIDLSIRRSDNRRSEISARR